MRRRRHLALGPQSHAVRPLHVLEPAIRAVVLEADVALRGWSPEANGPPRRAAPMAGTPVLDHVKAVLSGMPFLSHDNANEVPQRVGWQPAGGGVPAGCQRAWREALRFTTARADREFLRRRLAVCRPDGGEPATE